MPGTAARIRAELDHPVIDAAVGASLFETRFAHADVAALGIPILVVTGTDDALFPAPLVRDSAARLPGARVVEIADAGHSPYFEQPEAWNAALLEFLASVDD